MDNIEHFSNKAYRIMIYIYIYIYIYIQIYIFISYIKHLYVIYVYR